MESEGSKKKLADLEKNMLLIFFTLVEADEDATTLMKATAESSNVRCWILEW